MFAFKVIPPFCPVYERNKIFAFDFVYFIARECRTNWISHGRFIDPFPQMTVDIEYGARAILREYEQILFKMYEALVPPGMSAHVGIFYGLAVDSFRYFFNTCVRTEIRDLWYTNFFAVMVCVARLGILFYQRGVREAPDHAVLVIAEFLWHYMQLVGPGVFPVFQEIGRFLALHPEMTLLK